MNDSAAVRVDAAAPASAGPLSLLRRRDAIAIIVGIVVGAGIFRTPSMVADVTGDAGWVLALWVAGGVISLIGALCYAELAIHVSARGRRLPLRHARLRTRRELSLRVGPR